MRTQVQDAVLTFKCLGENYQGWLMTEVIDGKHVYCSTE